MNISDISVSVNDIGQGVIYLLTAMTLLSLLAAIYMHRLEQKIAPTKYVWLGLLDSNDWKFASELRQELYEKTKVEWLARLFGFGSFIYVELRELKKEGLVESRNARNWNNVFTSVDEFRLTNAGVEKNFKLNPCYRNP